MVPRLSDIIWLPQCSNCKVALTLSWQWSTVFAPVSASARCRSSPHRHHISSSEVYFSQAAAHLSQVVGRWISLRLLHRCPACVCSCLPQPHAVCGQHCLMPHTKPELHSVSHEPAGIPWMDIYLSLSFYIGQFFHVCTVHFLFVIFSLTLPRELPGKAMVSFHHLFVTDIEVTCSTFQTISVNCLCTTVCGVLS